MHPSVIKVKEKLNFAQLNEDSKVMQATKSDIYKLLKNIDGEKFTGREKISPKLVKKPAAVPSKPLCDDINNILLTGIFPDDAKFDSVSPIDKELYNTVCNFQSMKSPVELNKCFLKFFC